MHATNEKSARIGTVAVVGVLFAVVGFAAFWAWRQRAPLSRSYRRMTDERQRERGGSQSPESKPGTDPV